MGPRERVRSRRTRPVHPRHAGQRGGRPRASARARARAPRAVHAATVFRHLRARRGAADRLRADLAAAFDAGRDGLRASCSKLPKMFAKLGRERAIARRCWRSLRGKSCRWSGSRLWRWRPPPESRPSDLATSPCFGWTPSTFMSAAVASTRSSPMGSSSLRRGNFWICSRLAGCSWPLSPGHGRPNNESSVSPSATRARSMSQTWARREACGRSRGAFPEAYSRHPAKKSRGGSSERRLLNIQPDKQFILNLPLTRLLQIEHIFRRVFGGFKK